MGSRSYEKSRINLISELSQGKPFAKLSTKQKEQVTREAFLKTGREILKDWHYKNNLTPIPFTYIEHTDSRLEWNNNQADVHKVHARTRVKLL